MPNGFNKILEAVRKDDPMMWWREYPPFMCFRQNRVNERTIRRYLEEIFCDKDQKTGVYVHIPFCSGRCLFCKYYLKTPESRERIEHYLIDLERELELYAINFKKIKLHSLYIGGGTPTLLNLKQLEKLFQIINRFFAFKQSAQILIEGTPETMDYEKLRLLKKLGVTRLTIGAQSFDDKVLRMAGRRHSAKDIYCATKKARRAGIKYINLDIILGLPGEDSCVDKKLVKAIKELKPDCVSISPFNLGKGIIFSEGKTARFATDSKKNKFVERFHALFKILEKAGYRAVKGHPRSYLSLKGKKEALNLNSIGRWSEFDSVFGAGCGAASFLYFKKNNRAHLMEYVLNSNPDDYARAAAKGRMPIDYGLEFTGDELVRRYLISQLAYWGKIRKKEFFRKIGKNLSKIINQKFPQLKREGLVIEKEKAIGIKGVRLPMGREEFFLFCLKYLYSPKMVNFCEKYVSKQ